jgi:rhamnosyltransferase
VNDPKRGSAIHAEARPASVVIPTLNGGTLFRELLESLASQDVEGGIELLVIDSGSTDGTPEVAAAAGARVERIAGDQFGHGRTRNLGISLTSGEVVAMLTQDALPIGPSYLTRLLGVFDNPRVDGVYARQFPRPDCDPILAERLRQWSASNSEPELHLFIPDDPTASRKLFDSLPPIERYLCCSFDDVASAIRRTTWERIPLPERPFGEDVAWGREVLLAGGAIAFEPSACVEHSHRIRMGREFKRIYCDHANLHELFGLLNVPTWKAVRSGWSWQRDYYRKLLADQPLGRLERLYWRIYSIPYALLETSAQFLGARSHRSDETSAFWRWADSRIRAGI